MTLNPNSRVRIKCLVVYLRKTGHQRKEIAKIARIDEDKVTNYTNKYDESGLQGLLEENYHQPKSQLAPYTEQLKELFKKELPHTVNQAIEMIDKETGIRLKPSASRAFLKKMGMKCRRCGLYALSSFQSHCWTKPLTRRKAPLPINLLKCNLNPQSEGII